MFDLVFSAMSALNQVATFMGALMFWGLGGLLVGNAIYWRMHAVRVQGEVIGVRRDGSCLNAVYRYDSPAGETFEATSLEGSSSVRGKETGTVVPLWVIPEKPHEVQEARNHIFTVVGVVLLGAGVALFWVAVTAWRTGPMTWVMALLVVAHLVQKLRNIFAPKDKALPRLPWRDVFARLKEAQSQLKTARGQNAQPVQRVEELTALPEYRVRVIRQRAQLRRLAPFLVLAGVGLVALGVLQSRMLLRLESTGTRAPGSVTSLSSSHSSDGGVTYYPQVSYTDGTGRRILFRDSVGTNPPMYHVGEAVTVLYLPGEPGRAVIDRGLWNWLPSAILYILGGAIFAGGLAAMKSRSAGLSVDGGEPSMRPQG
jgi:hypothetical protein